VLQLKPVRETLTMARVLDECGYHRLWFSEHHGPGAHSASPLMMTSIAAAITRRIRVGPAGVLLNYHSPLQVASDTRLLELAFPGRIDLGIARATEKEPALHAALLDGRPRECDDDAYIAKIRSLLHFLGREGDDVAAPEQLAVPREIVSQAEVWILGISPASAGIAASTGNPFAFSLVISGNVQLMAKAIEAYRQSFTSAHRAPYVCVAIGGIAGETDAEAREALPEWASSAAMTPIVGSGATCFEQLSELGERYGIDEFAFIDRSATAERRLASYQILAEACGLANSVTASE
jgi:luciferase family oxidoreductase group 1